MISYSGVSGGDEQKEPLDYFAYYDEGIVVPERKGKGRGQVAGKEEGGEGKTPESGDKVRSEDGDRSDSVGEGNKEQSETASGSTDKAGLQSTCTCVPVYVYTLYFYTCTCSDRLNYMYNVHVLYL